MPRRQAPRRPTLPTWFFLLVLGGFLWFGFNYYQALRSGTLRGVLPVRPSDEARAGLRGRYIALISGHSGFDTGALCGDGLTEEEVNRAVTRGLAGILRQSRARVLVLSEYDSRLQDLEADLLLAVHADSCIAASGFKVARWARSPDRDRDDRLVACLIQRYGEVTGIPLDPNTITEDMTDYHAFRKVNPATAAAIIEVGYIGGDREVLTRRPQIVALGIAEGLGCFFNTSAGGEKQGEDH